MARSMGRFAAWTGAGLLALLMVLILAIALFPLNLFKGPVQNVVSEATGRSLRIDGDLEIDWGLRPRLRMGALQFGNAEWSDMPVMAEAESITATLDIPALFTGKLLIHELHITAPRVLLERSADGLVNWKLREQDPEEPHEPPALPKIGRLRIEDGRLRYRDLDGNSDIEVSVESASPGKEDAALSVQGKGKLHGEPFSLNARGDSLLALFHAQRPYRLRLELEAEKTRLQAEGRIEDPFQFDGLDMRMELAGPDTARLNRLLVFDLPSLPPYQVRGQLQRHGNIWKFLDFEGRVGDSDLRGSLTVDTGGEMPRVSAKLDSKVLELHDLGRIIGAEPSGASEEAGSPVQQQAHAQREGEERLLPDVPLNAQRLSNFDAKVHYRAARVNAGKLPIDALAIDFKLQDGELELMPLSFRIGDGAVDLKIQADTREQPMSGKLAAEVRNVDLRRVLGAFEVGDEAVGTIAGRATLWMAGDSISELLGSADGGMYLLMSGGYLDRLLVELAGLDAAGSVAAFLGDDEKVPIECAYADLQSEAGLARIQTLLIDSTITLFFADGSIDLENESLAIELNSEPKDWSPIALRGPLNIEGTFKDIEVRPGASVFARAAAAVLAVAVEPLSALLPLLGTDADEGEDSTLCGGLMESMQRDIEKEQEAQ